MIATSELRRWRVPSGGDGMAMRHVLRYWHLADEERIALMRALFDGELQPAECAGDLVPVGAARLNPARLREWLSKQRAGAAGMSIDRAANSLGIKQQVAYDLVRRGLLQAVSSASGDVVRPEALLRFSETFISLADIARRYDTSPKSMLYRLDAAPVTGPTVDGCRQYFYRREDLNPALVPAAHGEE